jgi:hypothetical protein
VPRTAGTPQGGVISPTLANLFLHYAFDTSSVSIAFYPLNGNDMVKGGSGNDYFSFAAGEGLQ